MTSLNQIFLIGRVGHTPEIRIAGQSTICNFTLAVNDRVKVNDQWTDQTEWFRCTAFGKTADVIAKYVKKGSLIFVSGKMKSRKYTAKDGTEKTSWEVTVSTLQLLDPKSEGEEQPTEAQTTAPAPAAQSTPKPESSDEDDELPF